MSDHTPTIAPASRPADSFAPLRQPLFLVLWVATVIGNIGGFIRDVASAWLMTDLSASPAAVALVQAAATLPVFLLAIPAGVLADLLDRKRLLIGIQLLLLVVSTSLLLLSATGLQSVGSLLALTFLGGVGAALMGPTWQAIVPELVDRKDLGQAVALGSLGVNVARAVGPALGGLILVSWGAAAAYGADVLSYLVVLAALAWWRRPAAAPDALAERFPDAMRAGLRYVRANRELHGVLWRTAVFFVLASAVWSLLPLVARQLLRGGAGFYGVLLGAVGAGAIAGAVLLPRLRERLGADGLLLSAACVTAGVMAALAAAPPPALAVLALGVLGSAWITALTTLNGAVQALLPNWVRGRSLAVYLTVFNGAMTLGSLAWGGMAELIGVPASLLTSAAALMVASLLMHRHELPRADLDLRPSNHWATPSGADTLAVDRGPVLVLVEYQVDPADQRAFASAIGRLEGERRRDGAQAWGITEDVAMPGRLVEWFVVESWAEHLRQHRRVSRADADVQADILRFHRGPAAPHVRHLLGLPLKGPPPGAP